MSDRVHRIVDLAFGFGTVFAYTQGYLTFNATVVIMLLLIFISGKHIWHSGD